MQTNSANGGHQHEPCKKPVNPGTCPCRVDMELCARGAKTPGGQPSPDGDPCPSKPTTSRCA